MKQAWYVVPDYSESVFFFFNVKASKNKCVNRKNKTGNDVQIVDC